MANISSATIANTLTVGGLLSANGGITTNGANIDVGTGNVNVGTVQINGTTNRITGLADGVAPNDAVNKGQLDGVFNELDGRLDVVERNNRRAFEGVAMGFAMNAAPLSLGNGEFGVTGGVGTFRGAVAGAVKLQTITANGIGFGANLGFSNHSVGGGLGISFKFNRQ